MQQTLFLFLMAVAWQGSASASDIYVSPTGRDSNSGAKARPLASIAAAQRLARTRKSAGAVTVWLRGGTYYLPQTLVFTPEDSGTEKAPLTYAAFPGKEPPRRAFRAKPESWCWMCRGPVVRPLPVYEREM